MYMDSKDLTKMADAAQTLELVLINQFPNDPWLQIISVIQCSLNIISSRPETIKLFERFIQEQNVDLANAPGFHILQILHGFTKEHDIIFKIS